MTTLTLQAEDDVVAKASEVAQRRHISLDAVLAEALLAVASGRDAAISPALERLRSQQLACESEGMPTREERNHRPSKFLAEADAAEAQLDSHNHFLKAVRESGLYYTGGPFTRDELNER